MSARSLPKRWLLALLGLVVLALGLHWWYGERSRARTESVAPPRFAAPSNMVFRDGRWVPFDADEFSAVLHAALARGPGLVHVSGTVRDNERGSAIPGAEVVFANDMGEASALADAEGRYELVIEPGFYRAFARAEGYVAVGLMQLERIPENLPDASTVGMPRGELAPVLAVFRDQRDVDMRLTSGARVVGTVYDTAGRPVSGAIISGRLAGFQGLETRLILGTDMDETGIDGAFELDVPSGAVELLAAHHDFAGPSPDEERAVYLEPGETRRVDLTLIAGCIIQGQVVDERGEPVGDGSLEEWNHGQPPNDYAPAARIESGRFRLARIAAETVRLRAWPWKSPPSEPMDFPCQDGVRFTDVAFVVPDATPDLEGTVLASDGRPIAGAYIDIRPFDHRGMAQQERADAYGEWAFFALPPGRYQLMAHVPEHGVVASEVTVPARDVTLVLRGTGSIAGKVRGMTEGSFEFTIERCASRTLEGERTVIFDEITMPRTTRLVSVHNGAFHIDDLPACTLHATARTPVRTQPVHLVIESGGIAALDLDLDELVLKDVSGQVRDASGAPATNVGITRVAGNGAPMDHYAYAVSDDSGAYRIQVYPGDQLYFSSAAGWKQVEVSGSRLAENIDVQLGRE